jgi:hypothetical protein
MKLANKKVIWKKTTDDIWTLEINNEMQLFEFLSPKNDKIFFTAPDHSCGNKRYKFEKGKSRI